MYYAQKLQLINEHGKLNLKKLEEFIKNESKFVANLLDISSIPDRKNEGYEENPENENSKQSKSHLTENKTSRARSLSELQQRLEVIKGKKKNYKEKLQKKKLKNQLKKKTKYDERKAKHKLERAAKLSVKNEVKSEGTVEGKPKETGALVYNKDDKIMYSKFDFKDIGKNKKLKQEKDPKKVLKKLEDQKKHLQELKEAGETEKATHIKEKTAWKNALAKAEGLKVKDDPYLLKKSIEKIEQKKRSSKKKWEKRIQSVEKAKQERQQKRKDNLEKRKKDKKTKKLKKAAKKGKVIPGF